ncbi:hypothetical protein RA178_06165 [Shewanella oncorhynchi]|uniref:Uncharacterized protein n=1 Tax=Shewanella oncorhynchi TaxID=2726434 RepID=A0AA50Q7G6_9GAMM|nr:hypothetical protein [Shewanella oncorhynchi]WMB74196.1 hypothetical protein RA178_06165 [Shewanella oncorhynchi]
MTTAAELTEALQTNLANTELSSDHGRASFVLRNKASVKAFVESFDDISKVETMINLLTKCVEEVKDANLLKKVEEAKQFLALAGITVEQFNELVGGTTQPSVKRSSSLAGKKIEAEVGVIQFTDANGVTHRTGLKTLKRPKTQAFKDFMAAQGLDYKIDYERYLVEPTPEELAGYDGDLKFVKLLPEGYTRD